MEHVAQLLLVAVVFLSLFLLGSASLNGCVDIVALQGYCLGLLPLFIHKEGFGLRAALAAAGFSAIKGFIIPRVLRGAIRGVKIQREAEPLVGYAASLFAGTAITVVAFALSQRLPVPPSVRSGLLVPVSLAVMMMGLFMTVSRVKALTQVIGYLVFENGIFLFGLTVSYDMPWLLETGVLLDAFVAIFIMGIVIHQIGRAFDSIHTDRLTQLRD